MIPLFMAMKRQHSLLLLQTTSQTFMKGTLQPTHSLRNLEIEVVVEKKAEKKTKKNQDRKAQFRENISLRPFFKLRQRFSLRDVQSSGCSVFLLFSSLSSSSWNILFFLAESFVSNVGSSFLLRLPILFSSSC